VREPIRLAGRDVRVGPPPALARIADTYPLPLAYSWSILQGIWDPRDRYIEQLRHAENMLAFLGSVSLAILNEEDYERAQLDLKLPWQGGISFGAWKLIVQRSAKVFQTYEKHPLASDIRKLSIGSENKGFGADIAALISARNDFHHGRGPVLQEDVVEASNEHRRGWSGAWTRSHSSLSILSAWYRISMLTDAMVTSCSSAYAWRGTDRGSRRRK
jgi:hypothetical protein